MARQVNLKPIDTFYNGFLFRSRLEARWAVFMDCLKVDYRYEAEGYDLDGVFYLPDFWLPKQKCFLEIKPDDPTREEYDKASRLAERSGFTVFIMRGQIQMPDVHTSELWYGNESWAHAIVPGGSDEHYLWCECAQCGAIGIEFDGRSGRIDCDHKSGEKRYNSDSPRLRQAYLIARSHRFETFA